jgi:hypothetical protein
VRRGRCDSCGTRDCASRRLTVSPDTIYEAPPSQLPDWARTEDGVLHWLWFVGAPAYSRWHTEGRLPDGGRIWVRYEQDVDLLFAEDETILEARTQ